MEYNLERIKEIFETEQNITATAKKYAEENGIEYADSLRRKFSNFINGKNKTKNIIDVDLDVETVTKTNQYKNDKGKPVEEFNMPSAWSSDLNRFLSIEEYCDTFGLDKDTVQSSKLVSHNMGHMVYNIAFKRTIATASGIDEEFIESIIKRHILPVTPTKIYQESDEDFFDRLVISDIHIAMDTSGSGNIVPLYDDIWNEEVLFQRLEQTVKHVVKYKRGNTLVIDELGDYVDGLGGQTTRKGHALPQNMSDKECFEVAVKFKIELIDRLICYYDKIICNSITEDNHSGVFGYFINSAVKKIVDLKYSDYVEYNVMERFINHYSIGKHTFLETHGKDSESLRFGFKPVLDTKQIEKIDQYCKEYNLYNGNFIEFAKGDSHQMILDYSTSNDFDYFNYPAFSPPSNWVKSNFGISTQGCVFQNIKYKENIKIIIPLIF